MPIKICHFGKQKHREQSANVTAFSGTGLADFAQVAQAQVLCSHTRSLPHTEHKSHVIQPTGVRENWGGARLEVEPGVMGAQSYQQDLLKVSLIQENKVIEVREVTELHMNTVHVYFSCSD